MTRRWLTASLGSVLLVACVISAGCTTSHTKTTSPCLPGQPATCVNGANSATSAQPPARPPSAGAPQGSLQAWGAAHLASLQALSSEAAHLLAGAGDANQVQQTCSKIGSDARAAISSSPPPDAATAARLKSGLTGLEQLARDCATAFKTGNAAASSRLVFEANQATAAINQVIETVKNSSQ
jgi:hypothetical protein